MLRQVNTAWMEFNIVGNCALSEVKADWVIIYI